VGEDRRDAATDERELREELVDAAGVNQRGILGTPNRLPGVSGALVRPL